VCEPYAAGYGIMFFWQLGVLQYLEQMYDLSEVTMVGSSAGSMLSVFAACDVQGQVRCSASVHS
jgi:predicted acylesterase/phospholipase RssA